MSMTAETVVPLRRAPRVDRPRAERAEVADWRTVTSAPAAWVSWSRRSTCA
ncbi:MAG TPA: hypothetical protein VGQ26_28200 [Streptosporangiaceae bacterium]|jgi:hypothetical protein|nr:hypothetical protein [Streptosporangiaceae bacterium]